MPHEIPEEYSSFRGHKNIASPDEFQGYPFVQYIVNRILQQENANTNLRFSHILDREEKFLEKHIPYQYRFHISRLTPDQTKIFLRQLRQLRNISTGMSRTLDAERLLVIQALESHLSRGESLISQQTQEIPAFLQKSE